jgi:hypothetical protein
LTPFAQIACEKKGDQYQSSKIYVEVEGTNDNCENVNKNSSRARRGEIHAQTRILPEDDSFNHSK